MQNGGLRTKGITKTAVSEKPLITVVTVVYNGAETLEQTILSVVNQTYDNIEYIIIDGSSTDGTLDIIKKYEDKIDYWQSEPDKGIYDAMNKGIKLANGNWIYILGSDDFLVDKEILQNVKQYFLSDYDVICGTVWSVNRYGFQYPFENNYNCTIDDDIKNGISAPHQGIFIRKEIMNKYLFDCRFKIASDFKLNIQLWTDNSLKILKIKNKIAYYSCEGTSSRTVQQRKEETICILKELKLDNLISIYFKTKENVFFSRIKMFLIDTKLFMYVKFLFHKLYKHNCRWEKCPYCHK